MPTENVSMILRGCGMSPREIGALDFKAIHTLPDLPDGFGLMGETGIGKTFALAQHLGRRVRDIVAQGVPSLASDGSMYVFAPYNFARWANWPDVAEQIKTMSQYGDSQDQERLLESLKTTGSLYLDDLGQERVKGEDDLSMGMLKVILDYRYRNQLPVFWSTNLSYQKMSEVYGARTASRMMEWSPISLKGADLRLKGGRK